MDAGVVGVGMMGRNHARIYSELKSVDNLYIYDINETGARNLAGAIGAHACRSMEELLKTVEAVSICVPTQFHFEIASKVIEEGIPCLIEKPICMNSDEGHELLKHIPDDLTVGVGHIERFNPVVAEVRRIMKKPLYIEAKRHNPTSSRITGSSVVEDLMIHDIDIIFNLLFPRVTRIIGAGNEDVCSAIFTMNGTTGHISASRKSSKKIRTIYLEEEDCTIEGDFMSQEVYVHRKPNQYNQDNERYVQENIIEKVMVNKVEPLRVELLTFIDCVRKKEAFPITPQQAVHNLMICELIKNGFKKSSARESYLLARSQRSPMASFSRIPPAFAHRDMLSPIPPSS